MERKKIAVCGATGLQGGSVIRGLLKGSGWSITGLSRSPDSPSAQALKDLDVDVVKADLEDKASLIEAFKDVENVFGVTQPWSSDYRKCNPEIEIKQGRNIVDACLETGVTHLVLSTSAHMEGGRTGIPHVDSKLDVEEYAQKKGIPCTFLQPVQFMDNLGRSYFPVKKGAVRGFVDGDAKVPYIATRDIGVFAAAAFENPEKFIGRQITLVGDFISGLELCETLAKIKKVKSYKYKTIPKILMRLFAREFYTMRIAFEDFGRPPYSPEIFDAIEDCRKMHPDLLSFEKYLITYGYYK